jgi:hypothetical protein
LTNGQGVTTQTILIFSNIAVRSSNLKTLNNMCHGPTTTALIFVYLKKKHPDFMKFYEKDLKFLSQFDNNHDEKDFLRKKK